jgi:hypothetical protein
MAGIYSFIELKEGVVKENTKTRGFKLERPRDYLMNEVRRGTRANASPLAGGATVVSGCVGEGGAKRRMGGNLMEASTSKTQGRRGEAIMALAIAAASLRSGKQSRTLAEGRQIRLSSSRRGSKRKDRFAKAAYALASRGVFRQAAALRDRNLRLGALLGPNAGHLHNTCSSQPLTRSWISWNVAPP